MPRTSEPFGRVEVVTETFTRRCDLPSGRVLRGDGRDFWSNGRMTWYGEPPYGWDESRAYDEGKTISYELGSDYYD